MDKFLESIVCSGSECLCWILAFLNLLAVFYLVFCSFWRVTRLAKISGWVWASVLICATVGILFFHTCIYTLLATIFTAMMLMAIMAVVLPSVREDVESEGRQPVAVKPLGSYVISETTEGGYVFGIYDTSRRLLVNSHHSYATLQKARAEISICRESGEIGQVEDRTGRWIKEEFHPKFVLCSENGKCFFTLLIQDEHIMLRSREFAQLKDCVALLERVKRAVLSTDVYYSVDKVSPDGYVSDGEAPVSFAHSEEITLPEAPAVEATVCDEPVPVQEAATAPEPEAELGPQ